MSRLTHYALGALLTLSPALIYAQNGASGTDQNQTDQSGAATMPGTNSQSQSNNGTTDQNQPTGTMNNGTGTSTYDNGQGTAPTTGTMNNGTATTPQSGTMNNGTGTVNNSGASSVTSNSNGTANRRMPRTASNWFSMLLAGSMLSGAGLTLRRLLGRRA